LAAALACAKGAKAQFDQLVRHQGAGEPPRSPLSVDLLKQMRGDSHVASWGAVTAVFST
jgi:hypothetical protein